MVIKQTKPCLYNWLFLYANILFCFILTEFKKYVHEAGKEDLQRLSVTPRFLWQGSRLLWTFVLIFLYFWIGTFLKGYGLKEMMNRIMGISLMLGPFFTKIVYVCGLVAIRLDFFLYTVMKKWTLFFVLVMLLLAVRSSIFSLYLCIL